MLTIANNHQETYRSEKKRCLIDTGYNSHFIQSSAWTATLSRNENDNRPIFDHSGIFTQFREEDHYDNQWKNWDVDVQHLYYVSDVF